MIFAEKHRGMFVCWCGYGPSPLGPVKRSVNATPSRMKQTATISIGVCPKVLLSVDERAQTPDIKNDKIHVFATTYS